MKLRVVLKYPVLLPGRQVAQVTEKIGRMAVRVLLDAPLTPLRTFLAYPRHLHGRRHPAVTPGERPFRGEQKEEDKGQDENPPKPARGASINH